MITLTSSINGFSGVYFLSPNWAWSWCDECSLDTRLVKNESDIYFGDKVPKESSNKFTSQSLEGRSLSKTRPVSHLNCIWYNFIFYLFIWFKNVLTLPSLLSSAMFNSFTSQLVSKSLTSAWVRVNIVAYQKRFKTLQYYWLKPNLLWCSSQWTQSPNSLKCYMKTWWGAAAAEIKILLQY